MALPTNPFGPRRFSGPTKLIVFALVGFVVLWVFFYRPGASDDGRVARTRPTNVAGRAVAVAPLTRRVQFFKSSALPTLSPQTPPREAWWSKPPKNVDARRKTSGRIVDATLFQIQQGVQLTSDYDVWSVPDLTTAERTVTIPSGKRKGQRVVEYLDSAKSPFQFMWVSQRPRIAYLPDFLTDEECDTIVALAAPNIRRSEVALRLNEKGNSPVQEVRTSRQTWLSEGDSPVVAEVMRRARELTGFNAGDMEPMQILYYNVSQKYEAHHDFFDPKEYGRRTRNRALTLFLYLNDVEEGGETWFPDADGKTPWNNWMSCDRGLKVHPRKRTAVLFYDMMPDGTLDRASLHGSCPVKIGHKWGATLWFSADAQIEGS